ncbi:hypothetical protein RHGRI_012162 [Rhododendron griersonianum]|uniref:PGG domain-containing protein n=1 Tax=Rhododendron griersonianum TaxID=479676 RepID=A0AAV6KQI5_9ERIC|nr:hypothetical protein RHGRI_012162 [Rhododendron griersonianum]
MKPSLYASAMGGDGADLEQHKDVLEGELTPNHNTVLHVAAQFGRCNHVEAVLEACPSLLCRRNIKGELTPNHNTVLHVAAQFGRCNHVEAVLEACPSLLCRRNIKGETPLHIAARDGRAEIVEALIGRAKRLEEEVESGLVGAVKEMLRATNLDVDTALHMAARNCHLEGEKYLKVSKLLTKELERGRGEDLEYIIWETKLDREEAERIMRATRVIKEEAEEIMRATKVDRDTALHMAARNRLEKENRDSYLEVVKLLSKEDAEFQHPPNNFQETPLYLAAERGIMGVAIVDTLVETYKSLLTYSGPCGRTALHAAALKDFTVGALIATITFAAAFTIPGGYDGNQGRDQGMAILSRAAAFQAFAITNTIAMLLLPC